MNRTWKHEACADGSELTTTTTTSIVSAGGAGVSIVVSDLVIWNEHATQGTTVEIYSGSTLIGAGPAGPAYGGFAIAKNTPLKCAPNEALSLKAIENGAAVKWSLSYSYLSGPVGARA